MGGAGYSLLRPGEYWKSEILTEIRDCDIFWLFWSRSAMHSPWVDWEWRNALEENTLDGIQPHPLEPSDVAPPPQELEELQFVSAYEYYLMNIRSGSVICDDAPSDDE